MEVETWTHEVSEEERRNPPGGGGPEEPKDAPPDLTQEEIEMLVQATINSNGKTQELGAFAKKKHWGLGTQ